MTLDEIEYAIGNNELSAAKVFTLMKQHIDFTKKEDARICMEQKGYPDRDYIEGWNDACEQCAQEIEESM